MLTVVMGWGIYALVYRGFAVVKADWVVWLLWALYGLTMDWWKV